MKVLLVVPFNEAERGVPSCLKRSTRTVREPSELLFIKTSSVAQPPFAANCGNNTLLEPPMVAVPVPVVVVIDGTGAGARLVTGIVLKFLPLNLSPITETGKFDDPADVIAKVPTTSEGIGVPLGNNCLTNSDIWCKAGTVIVVVASCVPSLFLSVKFTFWFEPFGFTMATPRFFERRPSLSTNRTAFVVRSGGITPACVAPKALLRSPNVSNTTKPVVEGLVVVLTGVTTA